MWTKIIAGAIGVAALGGATVAMAQEADPEWLRGPVAVIEDLVTDGTITRDQADTIVDTFRARRQAMGTRHEEMHEFWSDGVLTAEEIARLEVPNPFTAEGGPFAEALSDGQITRDEVASIRAERRETRKIMREVVEEFLSDGVLTAEEITRLEVPNPFTAEGGPFAEALSDGQITRDEFDTIKLVLKPLRGHHRDHRPGV